MKLPRLPSKARVRDAMVQVLTGTPVIRRDGTMDPQRVTNLSVGTWLSLARNRDALMSMSYLACELAKSRPIVAFPAHVYHKRNGMRTEATAPVAFYLKKLLTGRWNPLVKSIDGVKWLLLYKDTFGHADVRVRWEWDEKQGAEVPKELWPITGDLEPWWNDATRTVTYHYAGDQFTPEGNYVDREILRFNSPLMDVNGLVGRSVAEACADAVNLDIDLYTFYRKLITNGSHFPRWLETDQNLTRANIEELKRSIESTRGLFDAGGMRIFANGLRVKQDQSTAKDLEYVNEARWVLQTICRMTGVPPNEVYDNSQLTYSGNVEMSAIQFAAKTLTPECKELEATFDGLLRSADIFDDYVKFDVNGLLRGQYESRMKGYQIAVFTGFMTKNEVRELEELSPMAGGDVPMWPANYYQVNPDGTLVPPPKEESDEKPGAPGAAGDIPSVPEKQLAAYAEAVFHKDMRDRVRARFATSDMEDERERTRAIAYANRVLGGWDYYCHLTSQDYDCDAEIEELMNA